MRRLIYQVSVGKPSKLYEHCIKSVAKYCKAHNIDHHVQTEPILKIKPNPFLSNRSEGASRLGYLPIFEKENAFDRFPEYDQIAIIDSDVYIKMWSPNVFDAFGTEHPFGAVCEREMPLTKEYERKIINYSHMQYHNLQNPMEHMDFKPSRLGYEFFNMGVMLMNRSFHESFIKMPAKDWLAKHEFQPFINGKGNWKWSTDQTLLNYFLKKKGVKVKHMDWWWNGLFSANTRIQDCNFIHFFLKDKLPERGENVETLMRHLNVTNFS